WFLAMFTGVGDLDGDGRGEFLAGVTSSSRDTPGRALVLRGALVGAAIDAGDFCARLARVLTVPGRFWFGLIVATVLDIDGDGYSEWLIGAAILVPIILYAFAPLNTVVVVFSWVRGEIRAGCAGQSALTLRLGR